MTVLPRWQLWTVAALAAAVLALTMADLQQHYRGAAGAALAFGIGHAVAIGLCWWRPVAGLALVAGLDIVTAAVVTPSGPDEPWPWPVTSTIATFIVVCCVGFSYSPTRSGLRPVLAAAWLAANGGAVAVAVAYARGGGLDWGDVLPAAVLTAVAAIIADLVHSRRSVGGLLAAQQAATASEQDARLRAEERARIARELHDVVAHHLSVVVVRADSATRRVPGLDEAAVSEFRAIGDDARESLEQMRRVLRLLRSGDTADDGPPNRPQPGLADVVGLVADARDAGAHIEVGGELAGVDGISGLAAFRIVQEALTNAMRHAAGAPVTIDVARDDGCVRIRIENPVRTGAVGAAGGGQGLRGMHERASGVGGSVRAEPSGHGTFLVDARIPLPKEGP